MTKEIKSTGIKAWSKDDRLTLEEKRRLTFKKRWMA